MESARLTDLKRRASALIDAYQSVDHATFNHWFIEAVQHVQQLLREQGRSKPFFTLAEDWTWIQNATKEKASENYGARLLLDNWPTRLLREAEMLESRVIPAHSQLRQGQGYKADFRGYSIKIEQSPEGGIAILEQEGKEIYRGRPAFTFERGLEPETSLHVPCGNYFVKHYERRDDRSRIAGDGLKMVEILGTSNDWPCRLVPVNAVTNRETSQVLSF